MNIDSIFFPSMAITPSLFIYYIYCSQFRGNYKRINTTYFLSVNGDH